MTDKFTRRQVLKLLAIATGTTVVACTKLNESLKAMAQTFEKEDIFLPYISSYTESPSPSETITPPPSVTQTPEPTPPETPSPTTSPPAGSGTFVDGPGGDINTAQDFLMSDGWPTRNGGQHANFQMDGDGGQKAFLRFNLSSIPSTATCVSAKLYLYHTYNPENGDTVLLNVYSVSQANSIWIEGVGNIDPALENEPCWNALQADGSDGVKTPWAGSLGASTSGIDYEANSLGFVNVNPADAIGTEYIIDLNTSRIEDWFGGVNTNYGIVLIASGRGGPHLGSAENSTSGYRPKLVVSYE